MNIDEKIRDGKKEIAKKRKRYILTDFKSYKREVYKNELEIQILKVKNLEIEKKHR